MFVPMMSGAGGGAWQKVSEADFAGVAAVDVTNLSAGYDYLFALRGVLGSAVGTYAGRVSIDNGASFLSAAQYKIENAAAATAWTFGDMAAAAGVKASHDIVLYDPAAEARDAMGIALSGAPDATGGNTQRVVGLMVDAPGGGVNGFRFYPSAGTITGRLVIFRRKV